MVLGMLSREPVINAYSKWGTTSPMPPALDFCALRLDASFARSQAHSFTTVKAQKLSLFGRHYSFVSPSLSCLNLWFWECFPASRLLTLILNGGLRPPCPLRSTFARLGLTLRSLVRKLTRSLRSRRKSSRSLAGIIVSFRPHYLV